MSGGQGMKFVWENNQLTTEHGEIDKDGETVDEDQKWTTFTMHLRKPEKVNIYLIPNLLLYLYCITKLFFQLVSKC